MQVVANDLLTSYEKAGKDSKTILLLHGWGDRATGLNSLKEALSRNYSVIALDLPGFGGTQSPPRAWDLTDYAEFVNVFMKKIGIKNPYAVIGHSFGGALAIRALGQNILSADRLVLIASAGVRDDYQGRTKALRYLTKTGKALSTPLPKSVKTKLRKKVYSTIGSDMLVAEHLQATFKKVVSDDVQADAPKISIPVLLIYGEDDTATPVGFGERFHQLIDGSTLEVLPGAGHFVHLDRPAEVTKSILEFLK